MEPAESATASMEGRRSPYKMRQQKSSIRRPHTLNTLSLHKVRPYQACAEVKQKIVSIKKGVMSIEIPTTTILVLEIAFL